MPEDSEPSTFLRERHVEDGLSRHHIRPVRLGLCFGTVSRTLCEKRPDLDPFACWLLFHTCVCERAHRPPATVCVSALLGKGGGDRHAAKKINEVFLRRRPMVHVSITTGSCSGITVTARVTYSLPSCLHKPQFSGFAPRKASGELRRFTSFERSFQVLPQALQNRCGVPSRRGSDCTTHVTLP